MARDYYVESVVLLASGARTTTQTGADWPATRAKGCTVVLDMTVVGTGSVTISIQGKNANGIYYTILASAAITTNIVTALYVYPGTPAVANVSSGVALPRTWRVVVTANNANSATYSVGVEQHG